MGLGEPLQTRSTCCLSLSLPPHTHTQVPRMAGSENGLGDPRVGDPRGDYDFYGDGGADQVSVLRQQTRPYVCDPSSGLPDPQSRMGLPEVGILSLGLSSTPLRSSHSQARVQSSTIDSGMWVGALSDYGHKPGQFLILMAPFVSLVPCLCIQRPA